MSMPEKKKHGTPSIGGFVVKEVDTFYANIYIAGDLRTIENIVREYALDVGLCVTVTPTNFIFTNTYGIAPSNTTLTIGITGTYSGGAVSQYFSGWYFAVN